MKKSKHQQQLSDHSERTRELEIEKAKLVKELEEIIQTTESRCEGMQKLLLKCKSENLNENDNQQL